MVHPVNKKVLASLLVFFVAYSGVLYFKYRSQLEDMTTLEQGEVDETAPEQVVPVVTGPEPDDSYKTTPQPNVIASRVPQVQRPVPAVQPQRLDEISGGGVGHINELEHPLEKVVDPQPGGPEGDLAITGRVLSKAGIPVPGIKLIARAIYQIDHDEDRGMPAHNYKREVVSGNDGVYVLERLVDGDYHISTVATDEYSQAQITVRAGMDFADLIITKQRECRVYGTVTSISGESLAGVQVSPVSQNAPVVFSNKEGRYAFEVKLEDTQQSLVMRASRMSYEDKQMQLGITEYDTCDALELNIQMEPVEDASLAEVSGSVKALGGDPIAEQRIMISSHKLGKSYDATTDTDGRFVIREVEPGDDYLLSINADDAAYKDYFRKDLGITKNGLTLNIVLESLDTGTLRGQMMDMLGTPIPNFTLVLQTKDISYYYQRVLSDSLGNFMVTKVPAGELVLKTSSDPNYTVQGIRLAADAELQVPVLLDWGYDAIQGQVVSNEGYPVAGANIVLTWSHEHSGIRSSSHRRATADEQGGFRFVQLGPGSHRLAINAEGYKSVSLHYDVALQGSDLVVTLDTQ